MLSGQEEHSVRKVSYYQKLINLFSIRELTFLKITGYYLFNKDVGKYAVLVLSSSNNSKVIYAVYTRTAQKQ